MALDFKEQKPDDKIDKKVPIEKTPIVPGGCCKWCSHCKEAYLKDDPIIKIEDADLISRRGTTFDGARAFGKMPHEIMSIVFGLCSANDLKSLRFTNQAFARSLAPRYMRNMYVKNVGGEAAVLQEILAIAGSSSAGLVKSLKVPFDMRCVLEGKSLCESLKPETKAALLGLLGRLETLDIHFSNDGNVQWQRKNTQNLSSLVTSVSRLLSASKSIKHLTLSLTRQAGFFTRCIPKGSCLNLESLDIGAIQTTNTAFKKHLSDFLPGLKHLTLSFVLLRTGDWKSIFDQVAASQELEKFIFRSNTDGKHRVRHMIDFNSAFKGSFDSQQVVHGYEIIWCKATAVTAPAPVTAGT